MPVLRLIDRLYVDLKSAHTSGFSCGHPLSPVFHWLAQPRGWNSGIWHPRLALLRKFHYLSHGCFRCPGWVLSLQRKPLAEFLPPSDASSLCWPPQPLGSTSTGFSLTFLPCLAPSGPKSVLQSIALSCTELPLQFYTSWCNSSANVRCQSVF